MLVSMKKFFTEKGQGIVEYAVLLAFVVAIAAYILADGGFKSEVQKPFSNAKSVLTDANAATSTATTTN